MHSDQRKSLDILFSPQSLALVEYSRTYGGIGVRFFLKNLQHSNFPGRLYFVDRSAQVISGVRTYPSIAALPEAVDLAIICTSVATVSSTLSECAKRGIRNIHVLISDFERLRVPEGIRLEKEILQESAKGGLNVIGPNCLGPYAPASRLMPWGQIPTNSGHFAFISQNDHLAERMTQHAHFKGFGISKAVSIGRGTVLDSTDYLEYLTEEGETQGIGIYVDSVRDAKRFLEIARALNRRKPLFLWKGGEVVSEAKCADSDQAISPQNLIWENGIRQSRITRVRSIEEMADTAMAFFNLPPPQGRRLFILGGGGGNSVYYADVCIRFGLQIPPLTGETLREITSLIPAVGSFARNPVDAWRSFYEPEFMEKILEKAFVDQNIDVIVIERLIPRPTFGGPVNMDTTQPTIDYLQKNRLRKPAIVVVDGNGEDPVLAEEAARIRRLFCHAKIPAYSSMPNAAKALAHLVNYQVNALK